MAGKRGFKMQYFPSLFLKKCNIKEEIREYGVGGGEGAVAKMG